MPTLNYWSCCWCLLSGGLCSTCSTRITFMINNTPCGELLNVFLSLWRCGDFRVGWSNNRRSHSNQEHIRAIPSQRKTQEGARCQTRAKQRGGTWASRTREILAGHGKMHTRMGLSAHDASPEACDCFSWARCQTIHCPSHERPFLSRERNVRKRSLPAHRLRHLDFPANQ